MNCSLCVVITNYYNRSDAFFSFFQVSIPTSSTPLLRAIVLMAGRALRCDMIGGLFNSFTLYSLRACSVVYLLAKLRCA